MFSYSAHYIDDKFEVFQLDQNGCDEWNKEFSNDEPFEPGYYYTFDVFCETCDCMGPYESEEDAANAAYKELNEGR